jgi:hypothetical protein
MISEMDEMMIERLQLYQKRNNDLLPDRIFMFRDGVSEVRLAPCSCVPRTNTISGSIRHSPA